MTIKLIFLSILILLKASFAQSEYISLISGYQSAEHNFLPDDASLSTVIYGATLDLSEWRLKQQGIMARGPKLSYKQGTGFQHLNVQIPLYHWHKHQGIWLQASQQNKNMEMTVSNSIVFLNDQNLSNTIGAGSKILAEHSINKYQLYWHEAIEYKAPLNLIGVFYYSEASPAASTISTSNADFFDGVFTGFGLAVGRLSDVKGANFQWKLNLAQLDMSFSDNATKHRVASKKESSGYLLDLKLEWHYRYYLAPYWYLVPQINLGYSTLFQNKTNPVNIEFKALNTLSASSLISLQHRF
ncbi:MAG: hypothetical protein ACJA0E_001491 [Bermanella sp.]|jgi:hypothetical protein